MTSASVPIETIASGVTAAGPIVAESISSVPLHATPCMPQHGYGPHAPASLAHGYELHAAASFQMAGFTPPPAHGYRPHVYGAMQHDASPAGAAAGHYSVSSTGHYVAAHVTSSSTSSAALCNTPAAPYSTPAIYGGYQPAPPIAPYYDAPAPSPASSTAPPPPPGWRPSPGPWTGLVQAWPMPWSAPTPYGAPPAYIGGW
nr:transcription elongation factor SPT5-like [Aegilops tauschii subsp. strangulata]